MAVNFTKNQDEIIKAWQRVESSKSTQGWALFGYEGNSNTIKLMSTGSNGLAGLVQEFNCSLIQYAFCRVIDEQLSINKLVLINWQGDSSPLSRKGLCASHVGEVASYFKGCNQTITIRNDDEATVDYLMEQISRTSSSRVNLPKAISNSTIDRDDSTRVGSAYKKTDIRSEISNDRKSFWQRQQEEENQRLLEEKKRAAEKQAQFERERKLREESEAKKLAEAIKERDKLIEATRTADKQVTGGQPSSMLSESDNANNDDERVGRRGELLRRERNQETLTLISKGLIKNKRAIFEQASQQSQPTFTNSSSTIPRKPSGSIVTQRLNTFKSLDGNQQQKVETLTNGFAKSLNLTSHSSSSASAGKSVIEEVETTKVANDEVTFTQVAPVEISTTNEPEPSKRQSFVEADASTPVANEIPSEVTPINAESQRGGDVSTSSNDDEVKPVQKLEITPTPSPIPEANIVANGDVGVRAKALYDYQAADDSEISFDPDDIIGYIEKVDQGWWHGVVVTGKYKNQSGLFPANYVEELPISH